MIRVEEEAKSRIRRIPMIFFRLHGKNGSLKYDELKPLAEGTAKLYVTYDKNLGRKVAYKTLHADLRDSDIETKRFLREARVTANIQHREPFPSMNWAVIAKDSSFSL